MSQESAFEPLAYIEDLESSGIPPKHARGHARALQKVAEKLATKGDISHLETRLTSKLTIRVGSMLAGAVALLATLIKIL